MRHQRRPLGPLALAAVAFLVTGTVLAQPTKVVILGFDGADAGLVRKWIDQGELPHLAALAAEGTFAALEPTNPPQTPVSWSSFATGTHPGKTRIFDWLKRDPNGYLPDFAMTSESRRAFLFGERNGLVLGLGCGLLVALAILVLQLLVPWGWRARLVAALACGLVAGAASGLLLQRYLPIEVPAAINNRQGQTMWELASAAGLRVQVIHVPATFPAEALDGGHMLSGLGVPDMRGRIGTPSFYTSDPDFQSGDNEFSLELLRLGARRGRIETRIVGPYNKPFFDYVVQRRLEAVEPARRAEARRQIRGELERAGVAQRIDLPLSLEVSNSTCSIRVLDQTQTLRVGEWSDWVELPFPVNPLLDRVAPLRGVVRFKLLRLAPELELYMSPINFHPDCHPVAFSWPPQYAEQLRKRFGMYKTLGWAVDTWSLPSGVGDERLFLEDLDFTEDKNEQLMEGLLGDAKDDLYVQIFYFPDRVGHLFWRFIDADHPLFDAASAARWGPELLAAYKRMDALVGKARALVDREALFIVCSDHGFSSFRRGLSYNNWLVENGLMALKGRQQGKATLEKLFDTRELFADVDWSRTKAYALGLGSIYINLAGREKQGIVLPGPEYEQVRQQIKQGLEALIDGETGQHPVSRVFMREEMYDRYDPQLIPDLRVANTLNYRVSWQTSLGGFGERLIEDNTKAWSGDHCSNDPALVPGILIVNRKINTAHPRMVDIMPTVLTVLGIEPPADVDGKSLL